MTTEQKEQMIPEIPILLAPLSEKTKEALESLKGKGWVIVTLTGDSIEDLRGSGREIQYAHGWPNERQNIEALPSLRGDVIMNTNALPLVGSNKRNHLEQARMIVDLQNELSETVPDVQGIMGRISDCAAAISCLLDMKGEDFQRKWIRDAHVRTYTRRSSSSDEHATVGLNGSGLKIGSWRLGDPGDSIYTLPMFVPKASYISWMKGVM